MLFFDYATVLAMDFHWQIKASVKPYVLLHQSIKNSVRNAVGTCTFSIYVTVVVSEYLRTIFSVFDSSAWLKW